LPPQFPRSLIHHEPNNSHSHCGCALKRIGEDVSEKLDYTPGVFTVERHIRGDAGARRWRWSRMGCSGHKASMPDKSVIEGKPTMVLAVTQNFQ
jgi:transposase